MPKQIVNLDPSVRAFDAIAEYVEAHPTLTNLELNELALIVVRHAAQMPVAKLAAAIVLGAFIAVRDAPDALRGDQALVSEERAERRVLAIKGES